MKSQQKQQEASVLQSLLEEYLTLKPHRAVQRLLQENNLGQCFEIYNLLQQKVKSNTSHLRKVLYSKHENLHQCSEMISQIQDFAEKVKEIQNSIDDLLKIQSVQEEQNNLLDKNNYQDNPIQRIQQLMNNNKFTQALKQCSNSMTDNHNKQVQSQNQLYYINFLKVQIVQKLQQHLENTPLTTQLLHQTINTLTQFMLISTVQDLFQYIHQNTHQKSQTVIYQNNHQRTLLNMLYEKYQLQLINQERKYPLQQSEIVQVIFNFKLLTLNKSTQNHRFYTLKPNQQNQIQFLYTKVFHYFSDLLQILQEVSSNSNGSHNNNNKYPHSKLHQIFTKNIQKTIQQISQIFISDKRKQKINNQDPSGKQQQHTPTLTFENDLYQKLTNSQQFIDVLTNLQKHFVSEENSQIPRQNIDILSLIKNLWKDFYHQMLDIITEKINPSAYFRIQQSFNAQTLEQFQKFSVIPFQKLTKQKLQHYRKELSVFFSNFFELLNKSRSPQEKSAIVQYFLQLKLKIEEDSRSQVIDLKEQLKKSVNQKRQHSSKNRLEVKIRQILILFFLTQIYNNAWIQNLEQDSDLQKLLVDCYLESNRQQVFQILTFSKAKNPQSLFPELFQIIDIYINNSIRHLHLSGSQHIQRWQQQFDSIFGSYNNILKESQTLNNNFKLLILALIKTKLQQLEEM